jgi:hypothetical protein
VLVQTFSKHRIFLPQQHPTLCFEYTTPVRKRVCDCFLSPQHSGMEKHYKIPIIIIGIKVSGTKEFFFIFFFIHFNLATNQTQKDP